MLFGDEPLDDGVLFTTKVSPISFLIFFSDCLVLLVKYDYFFPLNQISFELFGRFCRFFIIVQKLLDDVDSVMGGVGRTEIPAQGLIVPLLAQFSGNIDKPLLKVTIHSDG